MSAETPNSNTPHELDSPEDPVAPTTSGFIDEELHAHANEAGVKALIPKPFSAKYFCDLLKDLFA